jgi:His-Xaa-Ser system radical SAM maturase HxsC
MCSQPPREVQDSHAAAELVSIIKLIPDQPEHLGITGGEPTLLGDGLASVLAALAQRLPTTAVTMLSNARTYSDESFVQTLAAVRHPSFVTSVPLYGDTAPAHDFAVQVKGAFDQTVAGLYNAARNGLAAELRVVLHKQTIPVLCGIVEFVYRNLPFIQHIALMGLEEMGYARANERLLWVNPTDYRNELEAAVRFCWYRRIPVSIYNLPLCLLPRALWSFARQSISDYKNVFLDECAECVVQQECAGFFRSSEPRYRGALRPITVAEG